jgi:hypothetical protein
MLYNPIWIARSKQEGRWMMGDFVEHIIDAPLSNLCVLAGLAFLAVAVVGNISGKIGIAPDKVGRIAAAVLGSVLLAYGVVTHVQSDKARTPPAAVRTFTPMQVDTDLFGADYDGFDASSPEACEAECKKDTRCKAWTYIKPGVKAPQARCSLKDHIPAPRPDKCCISGSLKTD